MPAALRLVSTADTVVGEPTTAAAFSEVAFSDSGSSAWPATAPLVLDGAGSPRVPANVITMLAWRSPSPLPSVGTNRRLTVQLPPPPVTTWPAQLSLATLK